MRGRYLLGVFLLPSLLSAFSLPGGGDDSDYRVVHGWPSFPKGFALGQVPGVAVDSHDHVLVFHRGNRPIISLDGESGEIVASWGDGLFGNPHGLAIDQEDNVWVTDMGSHQVFKFSHEGELLMTLGEKDVPAWDETHFNEPADVAVTPTGDFYVADGYGNQRVAKFSKEGRFLLEWGGKGEEPGEFGQPHGIALDAEGRVYIADRTTSRIQIFDENGKFLDQWKSEELGSPWGLDVGPRGFLYMVDGGDFKEKPPERNRALKLDLKGNILAKWGSFGKYDGQFYWAHDVAVSKSGAVYVVDVNVGMRVQKFIQLESQ